MEFGGFDWRILGRSIDCFVVMRPGPQTVWYFAYGSNMQRETFEGRRAQRPVARRVGRLDGFRLTFDLPVGSGERGVANIRAAAGDSTYGVLYRIDRSAVGALDRSEGVPSAYRKLWTTVQSGAHGISAFTYISPHRRAGRKPSARYIGLILEGAREHGLPPAWVGLLESLELAVDERK
jgi:cation transport regulator ChaC